MSTTLTEKPSGRIRPPKIGAEILGGDRASRVHSMPLMQPRCPALFEVTDDAGRDVLVRPQGTAWFFVSILKLAQAEAAHEPVAPEPVPDAPVEAAAVPEPERPARQPRRRKVVETAPTPVRSVSVQQAHKELDLARSKYCALLEGDKNLDKIAEAFSRYTDLVAQLNQAHPRFYESLQ